jgi:uncharacterized YccA/Bax inhibitor family protein
MMRTANPALNANTFKRTGAFSDLGVMTIQGTVNKTFLLLIISLFSATMVWNKFFTSADPALIMPWMWAGIIGGFIIAIITIFKKEWSAMTVPIYALLEGLFLGGISSIFEAQFPGIVVQAVALTFGVLFTLLLAYKSGLINPTQNFKLGVVAATGAIALFYFISIILSFFGVRLAMIHGSGPLGIGFSIFVVIIAALNLVLDFDFIERGAESGAPKYMEWYGAFGILVTLIWLYIEILRLLSKLNSRR